MKTGEEKIRFLAEKTGWNFSKDGGRIVLELYSGPFCKYDRGRAEDTFVFKTVPESPEAAQGKIESELEDFSPSDYAYFLQERYLEENPGAVVPPCISIAKFAENVSERLTALDTALDENLGPDSFTKRVIEIAERNGLDVFVQKKIMSDEFYFWCGGRLCLSSYIEYDSGENGYFDMDDKRKAEILLGGLSEDLHDITETLKSPFGSRKEKKAVLDCSTAFARDIASEFHCENTVCTASDEPVDFGDDFLK